MRRTALIALVALLIVPQAAHASHTQESVFQDDATLLYSGQARRDSALDELRGLGVDTIRVNVVWNKYAPHWTWKHKPQFDATDPNAYPFGELDALVAGATARGMTVQLTPTAPGPAWASHCKGSATARRICRPSPTEYGRFVKALGRRYPTVHRWSIWNEPNQGGWLTPQYAKHGHHWVRESAHIYRNLVRSATSALAASGHGKDRILLGETAPIGRTSGARYKRSTAPADFYRDLFCLDSRGRKLRGGAARRLGCGSFKRLAVNGVAHHPYTSGAGRSLSAHVGRSDITLRQIGRLSTWLNRAAHRGRIKHGLGIWLTEFGFQTNPPDRYAGTSLSHQSTWLNQADWIAWHNSRIRSVGQYELLDERARSAFQTGLRFVSGKAKPGLSAYRLPLWVLGGAHKKTRVWLQVRPEARLGTPQKVTIQYHYRHGKSYHTLKTATISNKHGYLYTSTRVRAAYWRFLWNGQKSRTAKPAAH